jgi:hypothetical protein
MFMFKEFFVALSCLVICGAIVAGAQSPKNENELPAGQMQNKARTDCLTCHDSHIIVQQRLSKTGWGKEVDKMAKWGAIVSPSDRDALVDYFSTNFPAEKPAYVATRSSPSKR